MASIEEQLKRIAAKKTKLSNGKTTEQVLKEAVDYLYDCIQRRIDIMYRYVPVAYKRRPQSEGLYSALYAEDIMESRIIGNKIELSLKFNDNVWASNFNGRHMSNVALLMNDGWRWHNQPPKEIERFTTFKGEHFIERGIDDFNRTNRWGVKARLEKKDKSKWY